MSKIDIYSQYISRQQYLLENSLVGGQKLISEREMLINRLMAEGFTSKQIEHILNEMPNWARSAFGDAFSNQGYESPQKSTKSITRPSAKPVSKSVVPKATSSGPPVSARQAQTPQPKTNPQDTTFNAVNDHSLVGKDTSDAIGGNPPGPAKGYEGTIPAKSSGPSVSARSGQSERTRRKEPTGTSDPLPQSHFPT